MGRVSEYDEREPAGSPETPQPDDTQPIGHAADDPYRGHEATQPVSQGPDPYAAQATGWPSQGAPGTPYDTVQQGHDPYGAPSSPYAAQGYPTQPYPQGYGHPGYPPQPGREQPRGHPCRADLPAATAPRSRAVPADALPGSGLPGGRGPRRRPVR